MTVTACQSRLSFLFLQAPQAPIVTVGESTVAREALATLVALKIWGVPVVDAAGAIVANFSVSDVRHLARVTNQADAEAALALPVLEFLRGYAQLHAPMEYRLCAAKCSVGCAMEYLMPRPPCSPLLSAYHTAIAPLSVPLLGLQARCLGSGWPRTRLPHL